MCVTVGNSSAEWTPTLLESLAPRSITLRTTVSKGIEYSISNIPSFRSALLVLQDNLLSDSLIPLLLLGLQCLLQLEPTVQYTTSMALEYSGAVRSLR